jgi:hypothetical protein
VKRQSGLLGAADRQVLSAHKLKLPFAGIEQFRCDTGYDKANFAQLRTFF